MKPFEGFGVSKVIDSDHPNFKPGDLVSGITGWEEYSLIHRTEQLRKIQPDDDIPLSYHVGLLGMILSGLMPIVLTMNLLVSVMLSPLLCHKVP
jgi:NADPH-dependent curcumin reductase CurA